MNPEVDFNQLPLRDIHLPEPVGWWPPAPGWWLLLLGALCVLVFAAWRRYLFRRHRAALGAIARIDAALDDGQEPLTCLQSLSAVLRRFAMTVAPPAEAAAVPGLTGPGWLEYLDRRAPAAGFGNGVGRKLLHAPYAPPGSVTREDARALARLCEDWIRAQKPVTSGLRVAKG